MGAGELLAELADLGGELAVAGVRDLQPAQQARVAGALGCWDAGMTLLVVGRCAARRRWTASRMVGSV
jgi:hypothetical protein